MTQKRPSKRKWSNAIAKTAISFWLIGLSLEYVLIVISKTQGETSVTNVKNYSILQLSSRSTFATSAKSSQLSDRQLTFS